MANIKKTSSTKPNNSPRVSQSFTPKLKPKFDFAFERINYIWMLVGIALLALGYILLIGGGSDDPDVFNYSLFNAQRLVVAPILMVAGIVVEVYAILLKPKQNNQEDTPKD
ncbi:MAG: DUF3098 domain-containing protein [Bacteroidales bacterium]|jgi:hypothetical protein|nr:DUF3098 domain-containing protein [Bacteroidales bacterium]MDD4703415.1 DUF3098 domain-containing protein [Bacteroidales bacterium]MDX9798030.1 DUF3098 domain-containing protein [Bacteroidales bacterium]